MTTVLIRFFDLLIALIILFALFPFLLLVCLLMFYFQGYPILFSQTRVGKKFETFQIYKFRTMKISSEDRLGLTKGANDHRITKFGFFLRKYKIDEFPQLFNILKGEMSVVGSRPQVPFYVEKFNIWYEKILKNKPGIFSPSAILFSNEDEILDSVEDPVAYYENVLIPIKCEMDIKMVDNLSLNSYFAILFQYFKKLFQKQI